MANQARLVSVLASAAVSAEKGASGGDGANGGSSAGGVPSKEEAGRRLAQAQSRLGELRPQEGDAQFRISSTSSKVEELRGEAINIRQAAQTDAQTSEVKVRNDYDQNKIAPVKQNIQELQASRKRIESQPTSGDAAGETAKTNQIENINNQIIQREQEVNRLEAEREQEVVREKEKILREADDRASAIEADVETKEQEAFGAQADAENLNKEIAGLESESAELEQIVKQPDSKDTSSSPTNTPTPPSDNPTPTGATGGITGTGRNIGTNADGTPELSPEQARKQASPLMSVDDPKVRAVANEKMERTSGYVHIRPDDNGRFRAFDRNGNLIGESGSVTRLLELTSTPTSDNPAPTGATGGIQGGEKDTGTTGNKFVSRFPSKGMGTNFFEPPGATSASDKADEIVKNPEVARPSAIPETSALPLTAAPQNIPKKYEDFARFLGTDENGNGIWLANGDKGGEQWQDVGGDDFNKHSGPIAYPYSGKDNTPPEGIKPLTEDDLSKLIQATFGRNLQGAEEALRRAALGQPPGQGGPQQAGGGGGPQQGGGQGNGLLDKLTNGLSGLGGARGAGNQGLSPEELAKQQRHNQMNQLAQDPRLLGPALDILNGRDGGGSIDGINSGRNFSDPGARGTMGLAEELLQGARDAHDTAVRLGNTPAGRDAAQRARTLALMAHVLAKLAESDQDAATYKEMAKEAEAQAKEAAERSGTRWDPITDREVDNVIQNGHAQGNEQTQAGNGFNGNGPFQSGPFFGQDFPFGNFNPFAQFSNQKFPFLNDKVSNGSNAANAVTSVNPVNSGKDKSQVTINSPAKTSLKAPSLVARVNKISGGSLGSNVSNLASGFNGRSMPVTSRATAPDRTPKTLALNINNWHKATASINKKV